MRIIPKAENGFVVYTPVDFSTSTTSSGRESRRSSKDSDKESTMDKMLTKTLDMLNLVKGLPNEMKLIELLATALVNLINSPFSSETSVGKVSRLYTRALFMIKNANHNLEIFNKAKAVAEKNGGLEDIAIDPATNRVWVLTKDGTPITVSVKEYLKGGYIPITNSNLLYLRKYHSNLAFSDNRIFDTVENAMGVDRFYLLVNTSKSRLGHSTTSRNGYMDGATLEIAEGLALLNGLSKEDAKLLMYSTIDPGKYKWTSTNTDSLKLMDALLDYIYTTLPDNAKVWASIKTLIPDEEKATKYLISEALLGGMISNSSFNINYVGQDINGKGNHSNGSSSTKEPDMTYLTAVQNGYGGKYQNVRFNPGSQVEFSFNGSVYGGFMDTKQNPIDNLTLSELLTKTGLTGITNTLSITMGSQFLNSNSLLYVSVENNGGVYVVLPSVSDGYGRVRPNFELAQQFNEIVDTINRNYPNAKADEKQLLLEKAIEDNDELSILLDSSGNLNPKLVSAFFVVDGIASDRNIDGLDEDKLLNISDAKEDIQYFIDTTKQPQFDLEDKLIFEGSFDKLYKGSVYIPITNNNRLAAIIFSGQEIDDNIAMGILAEYQRDLFKLNNTSADLLK